MFTRFVSSALHRASMRVKHVRWGGGGGGFVSRKRRPGEWNVDMEEQLAGRTDTLIAEVLGVSLWLWILFSIKADKGKFVGLYAPWLEHHEHHKPKEIEFRKLRLMGVEEDDEEEEE